MALHVFSFYRQLWYPLVQVPFTFYIVTYLFYEVGLFTNPSKTYFHEAAIRNSPLLSNIGHSGRLASRRVMCLTGWHSIWKKRCLWTKLRSKWLG